METEALAKYEVKASYANAARTAKRIVIEHNLPYERKGNKWFRK